MEHSAQEVQRLLAQVEREHRRRAEVVAHNARRARELSAVLESTHAHLALLDRDFNFLMVNSTYERGSGRSKEELIGRNHFSFFPSAENQAIFERVRDTGEPFYTLEKPFAFPEQPHRGMTWWNWTLIPIKDQAGIVEALVLSLFEVTPLVQTRHRIERLVQEMDAVFAAMTDGVVLYGKDGTVTRANLAAINAYGFDPTGLHYREMVRRTALQRDEGQPLPYEEMPAARALRGELVVNARINFLSASGGRRTVLVSCAPLRSAGEIVGAVAVWRDVTERELLLAQAQAARMEAEHAAELRERFMAILGHDLRVPLTAVTLTASALLQRSDLLDDATRKAARRIATSADRMATMIRDLLDYTRSRAGGLRITSKPVDLHHLAREMVEEIQASNPGRAVHLRVEGDSSGVWDPERLEQAITNLLANALRYGAEATPVEVRIDGSGDEQVKLEVCNQGPPIPESTLPHLFEAFRRGECEPSRGGLGLGLYIVQEIVSAHGGSISARSGAEGTCFSMTLPRR